MKKCNKCGWYKPLSEFNRAYCHGKERHNYCKECGKKMRKAHEQRIKEGTIKAF